jgi:hypothetical protein
MRLPKLLRALIGLPLLFASAFAAPAGYLFVTFGGQPNALSEQVYFATSRDGRDWTALNNGDPVLVSDIGQKGARDPYLLTDSPAPGSNRAVIRSRSAPAPRSPSPIR